MFKDGNRLLFRKSDRVLLEFACDDQEVMPSRGIRLDEGSIADFCYSADGKSIYIVTSDGHLHYRSKSLDKDYIVDSGNFDLSRKPLFWSCSLKVWSVSCY